MRVVFMGTPEFAVPSLESLAETTDVVGVFSRPDAVSGRGKSTRPSPVTAAADRLGIPVFKPRTLRAAEPLADLKALRPDVLVVAAYGLILPPDVLDVAPLGAINVHASLLPRWRGAAPIQRAILAGDAETGVSIMRMEEGLDTGPYCAQRSIEIGEHAAADLTEAIARLGAEALVEALPRIAEGSATWTEQDESLVTYAEKITKRDVAIGPELPADVVLRRVRASLPAAPVRIEVAGRPLTVISAAAVDPLVDGAPGPGVVACSKRGVLLGVEDGAVALLRIKPDGKGEMAALDWSRGVRELDGATWDALR